MHRRRGFSPPGLLLVMAVAGCQAQPAGTPPGSAPPSVSASVPSASPAASPAPSEQPSASAATSATPAGPSPWTETGSFGGGGLALVTDVTVWDAGFLATGNRYPDGTAMVGSPAPVIWTSPDGRAWEEATPDVGTTDLELFGAFDTADGVMLIGMAGAAAAVEGGAPPRVAAWTSSDAVAWTEVELPFGAGAIGLHVTSGPVGHLVSLGEELWFSPDGAGWRLVLEAPDDVSLGVPVAGAEGFVVVGSSLATEPSYPVFASGDGVEWFDATLPVPYIPPGPLGGDWHSVAFTTDPQLSLAESANGLDWTIGRDINEILPPGGPTVGQGQDSDITGTALHGEGGVLLMSLGWNHCCAQPPIGVEVLMTTDGETWTDAGLAAGAAVTAVAADASVVVAAGYLERGVVPTFWAMEP